MPDPRDVEAGLVKSSELTKLEMRIQQYGKGGVWSQVDEAFRRQQLQHDILFSKVAGFKGWKLTGFDGALWNARHSRNRLTVKGRTPEELLERVRAKTPAHNRPREEGKTK